MKLAISFYSYYHAWRRGELDMPAFVHEAKRAGADGVELLDYAYGDRSNVEEIRAATLRALAETGLPVSIFSVGQNFAKTDPAAREAELQKIRNGVDEALLYGASVVRVFAGDVADGITFDQARSWIVEGLAEASKYAEDRGVLLALENHGTLAGRGDQVRGLIHDVRVAAGNSALGANPDTGNFLLVDQLSHEAIAQVAEFANMVHFKDFRREPEGHEGFAYAALDGRRYVGTAVGEGEVDLAQCIAELRAGGFDGWLSVEYEGEEDSFTAVPRSIANARRYL
jgi:hypothetical protein